MSHKRFAEHLNQALDDIGAPAAYDERIEALARLLKIHRFKAETLITGQILPDEPLLSLMCEELDIKKDWLTN